MLVKKIISTILVASILAVSVNIPVLAKYEPPAKIWASFNICTGS